MKINNQVQFITINNNESGQRIDNFLFTRLKRLPKNMVYRIIRKGEVRINMGRVKHKYKLKENDLIRIPPVLLKYSQQNTALYNLDKVVALTKYIIYEDEDLLVLNKPSGMSVHGGSGVNFGVIEALRILYHETSFLELVHRLDRETSGALLIAKKRSVLRALHQQLRLKQMQKQYIALVKGQWPSHIKVIKVPLLKNISQSGKRVVKVSDYGKYSETHFEIQKHFLNFTLVKVTPITGRTHQIRVHTQYASYPIACDNRYGDLDFNKQLTVLGLNRLFLHASSLMFIHPVSTKKLILNAPLDKGLKTFLERFY
ncbi:MAG: 23S rRNA pseudouridine(955/2504/2580) synthase RluC [Arsenophonus sp.]